MADLDPDLILADGAPMPAGRPLSGGHPRARPGVPARRNGARGGAPGPGRIRKKEG
jgi:hypothetical protein